MKTIVVAVVRRVPHAKFGKIVKMNQEIVCARREEPVFDWGFGACRRNPTLESLETLATGRGIKALFLKGYTIIQIRSRLVCSRQYRCAHGDHDRGHRQTDSVRLVGDVITRNVKEASASRTVKRVRLFVRLWLQRSNP